MGHFRQHPLLLCAYNIPLQTDNKRCPLRYNHPCPPFPALFSPPIFPHREFHLQRRCYEREHILTTIEERRSSLALCKNELVAVYDHGDDAPDLLQTELLANARVSAYVPSETD